MPALSLVIGILAILGTFFNPIPFTVNIWLALPGFFGWVLGILAIILAVKGKKACIAAGLPTGLCTAGLVLGIIATAIGGVEYAYCAVCTARVAGAVNEASNAISSLSI